MGAFGSEYKDIIAFLVLIVFIVFRPPACSASRYLRRPRGSAMKANASPASSPTLSRSLRSFGAALNRGATPYVLSTALLVVGTVLVYLSPGPSRPSSSSPIAASLCYFLDMKKWVKLGLRC